MPDGVAEPRAVLDASGVRKSYGAVAALKDASLSVRAGEVHALMGANGAGKSTLVKILTGAVRPDGGRILVNGAERRVHSPADARRGGLVSVYQEPSLAPDLDVFSNLRLTDTAPKPVREWLVELGAGDIDFRSPTRELPLAVLRVLDLARALAMEPEVLLLDEITAALPADMAENVLKVVKKQSESGRAVIFISHRMLEISNLCDRATVLRDGETVGVLEIAPGVEEEIVELMLGGQVGDARAHQGGAKADQDPSKPARIVAKNLAAGNKLKNVSFELQPGEVLGVVALEGQGQDELFDVLSGMSRPTRGEIAVEGVNVDFNHPADAIKLGIVSVPGDRAEALLMQRSVRENIALPSSAQNWGPINVSAEKTRVDQSIERLQIDTRAMGEVRRLSGGNQQKVTIARWIASGVQTLLCFDPTRGIDIRTKRQIYALLRDLAEQGASVLLYTSELEEVQLACDRAVVIFGGEVVDVLDAAVADEPTLMRAAYGLPPLAAAADPA